MQATCPLAHQSHITPCIFVVTWSAQTAHGSSTCFLLLVFFWGRSISKWIQLHFITTSEFARTEIGLSGISPIGILGEDEHEIKVSRLGWVSLPWSITDMNVESTIHNDTYTYIVFFVYYIIYYLHNTKLSTHLYIKQLMIIHIHVGW